MTVYLVHNPSKPEATGLCVQAAGILAAAGAQVLLPPELEPQCPLPGARFLPQPQALELAGALVTVGGDGTILHAAKACFALERPLLGINLGRTGFLATCEVDEMQEKLTLLAQGKFGLDPRALLKATVAGDEGHPQTALNDVVIYKGRQVQTIDFDIFCDDILVNHVRSDGVIVATPTGSTAYSLSAGGRKLDAPVRGVVVTPICAHSLHSPSIVFAADRRITIRVDSAARDHALLSSDGEQERALQQGGAVQVELLDRCVKLITFNPADQFDAIDKKLRGR